MNLRHQFLQSGVVLLLAIICQSGGATPVTSHRARCAAKGFMGRSVKTIEKNINDNYYIATFVEGGFAVLAGDDALSPVVAFSFEGHFDNAVPLPDWLKGDMALRQTDVALEEGAKRGDEHRKQWQHWVEKGASDFGMRGLEHLEDPRVDPLTKVKWNQSEVNGKPLYNLLTPKKYKCGCVATALSQFLRHHEWPKVGIGEKNYHYSVEEVDQEGKTRGGDGKGGPYAWSTMPLDPAKGFNKAQAHAIAALTSDVGLVLGTDYTPSGSGANGYRCVQALRDTFGYAHLTVFSSCTQSAHKAKGFAATLNSNLDAHMPVLLGMLDSVSGGSHMIICDGYGYHAKQLYHHINMGWGGSYTLWYALPEVDTPKAYSFFRTFIYNVYPEGGGQIASGRVKDKTGKGLAQVNVLLKDTKTGQVVQNTKTNGYGIYAFTKLPAQTDFQVLAEKTGHAFAPLGFRSGLAQDSTDNDPIEDAMLANQWDLEIQAQ